MGDGSDVLCRAHDGIQHDVGPGAVAEFIEAEGAVLGKGAAHFFQLASDDKGGWDHGAVNDAAALKADKKIGEILRLHIIGGKRHGDIIMPAPVKHHMLEEAEFFADAGEMGGMEAGEDAADRAVSGFFHHGDEGFQPVHGAIYGDKQQAKIDKYGDGQRDVVALIQARLGGVQLSGGGVFLIQRADGFFAHFAQVIFAWRHFKDGNASQGGAKAAEGLNGGLGAFDGSDFWFLQRWQLVEGLHNAAQSCLQLVVGAFEGAAAIIRENGGVGALGKIVAD